MQWQNIPMLAIVILGFFSSSYNDCIITGINAVGISYTVLWSEHYHVPHLSLLHNLCKCKCMKLFIVISWVLTINSFRDDALVTDSWEPINTSSRKNKFFSCGDSIKSSIRHSED